MISSIFIELKPFGRYTVKIATSRGADLTLANADNPRRGRLRDGEFPPGRRMQGRELARGSWILRLKVRRAINRRLPVRLDEAPILASGGGDRSPSRQQPTMVCDCGILNAFETTPARPPRN